MTGVVRLVTVVDTDDQLRAGPDGAIVDEGDRRDAVPGIASRPSEPAGDSREMSFSALHQAVLNDGTRVTLLDDRGWSIQGPPGMWQRTSAEEIAADARAVVGPDEPFGSHSRADMESAHWSHLASILREKGVQLDSEELSRLPHKVELSERVRARLPR